MEKIKNTRCFQGLPVMFLLSFLLWILSFRGFLFGQLRLDSDAISYYDHIKFYIDNILRGIYPLWDPVWNPGVPNEFFLRRIGVFNPFFIVILVLRKIGIPHFFAYLAYLTIYYFTGMIGFYLLAKRILCDTKTAFAAYLLLMFSSLGARLFDSYIMFAFVPMVWFFYFLVAFTQKQEKHFFLGIIFTLMIILTTYIPFYFVTIFVSFVVCFSLVYWRDLKAIFARYFRFLKSNKILVCLCVLALVMSFLPGLMLYQATGKGELSLPSRHYDYDHTKALAKNELEVDIYNITKWGALEDIVYSVTFSDLRKFKFAVLYIPIFAYILFFLGAFTSLNKRLVLFALWAFVLFLIAAPFGPCYQFFYDHVFFFKYFRNLHFFLWFALLPAFILFLGEQMRIFLDYHPGTKKEKYAAWAFLLLVHFGFLAFLYAKGNAIVSSYMAVGLSLTFFILHQVGIFQQKRTLCLFFILGLIAIQPLEVYQYLEKNSGIARPPESAQIYDRPYRDFSFVRGEKINIKPDVAIRRDPAGVGRKYIVTKGYNFIFENLAEIVLEQYLRHRFIVYDNIEPLGEEGVDIERIGRAFLENQNVAFVASSSAALVPRQRVGNPSAQKIEENSGQFQVLKYDSNSVKVKTNFNSQKFLVYNDCYHSSWQVFINGKRTDLFRANVAFKGVWVPAGENIVYFRYGEKWRYFIELFLLGIFNAVFFYLLWLTYKSRFVLENVHDESL